MNADASSIWWRRIHLPSWLLCLFAVMVALAVWYGCLWMPGELENFLVQTNTPRRSITQLFLNLCAYGAHHLLPALAVFLLAKEVWLRNRGMCLAINNIAIVILVLAMFLIGMAFINPIIGVMWRISDGIGK